MKENNYLYIDGENVGIKAWVKGVQLEEQARQQLINIAKMPFVFKHVAAMPDCHFGRGATVGSVIATKGAVIPAAVGVDLGCGMIAQKTTLTASDLPEDLKSLRSDIEASVPHGRTDNGGANDKGAWASKGELPKMVADAWAELAPGFDAIVEKHAGVGGRVSHFNHLGTLGTGNHFIEICLDEQENVWVMLHSGSRGVGNRIGVHFIELAKQDMKKWMINLPDEDLAYIPQGTEYFRDYLEAVEWAQNYALKNREIMLALVLEQLSKHVKRTLTCTDQAIQCHHNYISWENHFGQNVMVTRKGAVSAKEGQWGIIPGSMGVGSYIVQGKGNPESFHSCSHGAGRSMSRGEAKRKFSLEDHAKATSGIECRKDADVLDETPGAYKPLESVMEAQSDLVSAVYRLKPLLCVKG